MNQDQLKQQVAQEAMNYIVDGSIIGIGTGSTVNFFITELIKQKHRVKAAVSSSQRSSELLRAGGIEVLDLNQVQSYPVYVDGADEVNHQLHMIKGGGAALTREKIVSALAQQFICIVDNTKLKPVLGAFALPVEVIPLARNQVMKQLAALGGQPKWRENVVTDNGNHIIDVAGLHISDPVALETTINNITGVVESGLFARKPADLLLIADPTGLKTLKPQ